MFFYLRYRLVAYSHTAFYLQIVFKRFESTFSPVLRGTGAANQVNVRPSSLRVGNIVKASSTLAGMFFCNAFKAGLRQKAVRQFQYIKL
jgi:hypothetical protein